MFDSNDESPPIKKILLTVEKDDITKDWLVQ